jgi:hypothetical protein
MKIQVLKQRLINFAIAAVAVGLFALEFATFGMDAARDAMHRADTFTTVSDARLVDGKCKSRMFVLTACTLQLQDDKAASRVWKEYFFLGRYEGQPIRVLRSQQDQSYLMTNLGRDEFWGRLLVTVPMLLLFFLAAITALKMKPLSPDNREQAAVV